MGLQKDQGLYDLLRLNEKMLYAITESANELLSNIDFSQAVSKSLKLIGEAIGVGRISVYENHTREEKEYTSLKFEWNSDESKRAITDFSELELDLFRPVVDILKSKQIFQTLVGDLSDDFIFKKLLQQNSVKSILIIPIYWKNHFWGFIAFNEYNTNRIWNESKFQLLISFTNCIASAIDRDESSKRIIQSNEQLQIFQYLIDNSSDGIQVSYESGQLYYLNKTASERLGIKIEDCCKYYVKDIETVFSDDDAWRQHVEDVKGKDFVLIQGENISVTTGRKFPVEVTVKYIKIGEEGFMVANSREITDRVEKETQLKHQEEKYRNIITNMNLGLLEVDLNHKVVYCNQSFNLMSGYTLSEIIGKNAIELFINDSNDNTFIEEKMKARRAGKSDSYELLVKNKQGESRWWLLSGAPNYNDKGEFVGTIGIHLDITEQKQLELDLENALLEAKTASQAKEAFLANMSHEIRTPLHGIIGMIRELDSDELSKIQKEYVEGVKKGSQHLLSIVNNVLDFSKIEAGELQLNRFSFSLEDALNDVSEILANQVLEKGIYLDIEVDPQISPVLIGDEGRIRQILMNIIGNAIKFTETGGVKISCVSESIEEKTQHIMIKIQDTGIGMGRAFLDQIFTKFHQEDISNSRKYGGSGLGMVITKELIDLMNGSINITSHKNEGTEVVIGLTFEIGEQNSIQNKDEKLSLEVLKGKKVLLVEDNLINQLIVTNVLSRCSTDITVAGNGLEAVELLKKQSFDLILMDLQMPVMNGLEATTILRNDLKIETPVIALSANAFQSEIDKCMLSGMNEYIVKPFEEKNFIEVITNVLIETCDGNKEVKIEPSKLYNFRKLKELGDEDFVLKMCQLFIETTPQYISKIEGAIEEENVEEIKQVIHTLKPILDNFLIDSLRTDFYQIEQFETGKMEIENFMLIAHKIAKVLSDIVLDLKKE